MRNIPVILIFMVFSLSLVSFQNGNTTFDSNVNEDSSNVNALRKHYPALRQSIEVKRKQLYQRYVLTKTEDESAAVLKEASLYLRKTLVNQVYPTWYGTVWDYNGITEIPGEGYIACGYFVSTTLKHVGVNLNRYKVAQQYSHSIVNTLCNDVKVFDSYPKMMAYVRTHSDDVYIVGLDNHVGHISKEGNTIQFIHSSYVYPSYVISEPAATSPVLYASKIYVVGNLTSNSKLIQSWLMQTPVVIVK